MSEDQDFNIPSSTLGQSLVVLADVVASYIGATRSEAGETDLKKLHQMSVAVFLHSLLMRSQHKQEMAGILDAIAAELREKVAGPAPVKPDWREDPSADESWQAGCDFAMVHLCMCLGVDTKSVSWDAATESLDGDVSAVLWNILRAKLGDDWDPHTQRSEGD